MSLEIAAGEVALVGGGVPERADTLTARAYPHPSLEGRIVVRLTPDALASAEDLTMDYLGFHAPASTDPVGLIRQQALGFPAWALVNDPANAQHALNLVKDIERHTRTAKTKPGHAKDGFDTLAERLAAAVPHYLPTFYEQVARIFLDLDNKPWAALHFGKARDAERAYSLPIDEDAQAASYLEFAFAGALTAKALSAYAKDLAARCAPLEAYRRFQRVCIERVKGGLPPHPAMPAELRRLAEAAELDAFTADQDLMRELLALPAVMRSNANFWSSYRDAIAALGRADAAVRGLLLNSMPPIGDADKVQGDVLWLSILEAARATDGLTRAAESEPAEALPRDGAAGWLARFVRAFESSCRYFDSAPPAHLLELVARMAERLRDEGVAVRLADSPLVSVVLVDHCLAKGIPIADPVPGLTLTPANLSAQCAHDATPDLSALAADTRFRPVLDAAVKWILENNPHHSTQWMRPPGIRSVIADRLDALADSILGGGFQDADRGLSLLCRMTHELRAELRALNPQAWHRITAFDAAVPLADTLRHGILDEYGWPALEEACAQLPPPRKDGNGRTPALAVTDQWPYLIVSDDRHVAVVGHDRIVHSQDLPALPRSRFGGFIFGWAEGQLSVTTPEIGCPTVVWSGSPHTRLNADSLRPHPTASGSIELPDGARSFGARPYRAGDTGFEWLGPVATDGENHWVLDLGADGNRPTGAPDGHWRELEPYSGHTGAPGAPRFFTEATTGGAADQLISQGCSLVRLPDGVEDSPLGSAHGLAGWRVTQGADSADGAQTGTGIDGRTVSTGRPLQSLHDGDLPTVVGAIRFPGAADDLAIVRHGTGGYRYRETITLHAPDGHMVARFHPGDRWPWLAHGTTCLPPLQYWHFLTVRDEAGSAALRRIDVTSMRTLLDEAAGADREALLALIGRSIPEITAAPLLRGVVGLVQNARHCLAHVADLAGGGDPAAADATQSPAKDTEAAATAQTLRWVRDPDSGRLPEGAIVSGSVLGAAARGLGRHLGSLLGGRGGSEELTGWKHFEAWPDMRAHLYDAAVGPWFGKKYREVFTRAEELRSAGLLSLADRIRVLHITPPAAQSKVEVIPTESGHAVAFKRRSYNESTGALTDWQAVEIRRQDAEFGALPGWSIERQWRVPEWPWPETPPADAVRLLEERGEIPWRPEYAERLAAAAGISRDEAAVWLLGMPGFSWQGAETPPTAALKRFGFGTAAGWQAATRPFLIEHDRRNELLGVLLPERANDLWTTGPDVKRAADYWVARHGRQVSMPAGLLEAADKELRHERGYSRHPTEPVVILRELLDSAGRERISGNENLDNATFGVLARTLLWLAYRLPAADPLRAQLPAAAETVRALLLQRGREYHVWYSDGAEAAAAALGLPVTDENGRLAVGPLLFSKDAPARPGLRPSMLSGADDPVLALVDTRYYEPGTIPVLRLLLGSQLPRLLAFERPAEAIPPYPAQDPTRSVPDLVAEAAAGLQLSEDAAALYLMLLALPDPTDRHQATWTEWKPARLKAARAELTQRTDLVVSGSRPRAGRSLFLPGTWLALKAPHLPAEGWKSGTLGIEADGAVPLGVVLPQVPVPELFHLAWHRVRTGDAPRFDDLTSESKR